MARIAVLQRVRRAPSGFSTRLFSSTTAYRLSGLRINSDRLQETIHETCKWGAAHRYGSGATETGMARLTLSEDDRQVRQWLAEQVEKLDCVLATDRMGDMFARRAGELKDPAPMTAMGSHLDTQPRGGRYDGILGVMAALEVLRTMTENGFRTAFDVGLVNWTKHLKPPITITSEEGARFPLSMCASGVWAGATALADAWNLKDINSPSITLRSELEERGLLGDVECSNNPSHGYPLGAHFELHIEQGPVLEAEGRKVGVVGGAQGYRWLTFSLRGQDAHTGTTPLGARRDPVLAAAKMIAASNGIAKELDARVSTGILKVPPSASTNTLASEATFTLDIRHPDGATVAEVQQRCLHQFGRIAKEDGRGVEFDWALDSDSAPVRFHPDCIGAVEKAANELGGPSQWLEMASGAGHDSVHTSKICPTAMVFVPCKDGVSHNPVEYCTPEDCATGAQTLLEAVFHYDRLRASGK